MSKVDYGKAVLECNEEIPCNPCVTICRTEAITKESLTAIPEIDIDKCFGCRLCVAVCPGQAIFMVNEKENGKDALISFPYEYYPLPEEGNDVDAVNRSGAAVCTGSVLKVDKRKQLNKTPVITIQIPASFADDVRSISRLHGGVK